MPPSFYTSARRKSAHVLCPIVAPSPPAERVREADRAENESGHQHRRSPGVRPGPPQRHPDHRVAHGDEGRPLLRGRTPPNRVELGRPERVADREVLSERLIEGLNERDGASVGDPPLGGDHAPRAGLNEWRRQALDAFAFYYH